MTMGSDSPENSTDDGDSSRNYRRTKQERRTQTDSLRKMFVMKLVRASVGGILFLFASFAVMEDASASQGSVYAINCANCLHVQDFANAAKAQANNWDSRFKEHDRAMSACTRGYTWCRVM